ncbi:SusD/RagB family nutrient-binding outer membrane lipoprotein [Flavobacterium sp.]|uniref:SusD/RagB family nutrient-binding outer membrane lipoprotein n=1 Tax=Flavobacterium sp. TaxID=239 RepID=UPI003266F7A7
MKTIKITILIGSLFFAMTGCDDGFEELNTNPYAVTTLDPSLLFAESQRLTPVGTWTGESTIVQQFVLAYDTGATSGANFNDDTDNLNNDTWDAYTESIKLITQSIANIEGKPERANLYNMLRIWRSYVFMNLADSYGDVPYTQAGKAYLEGNYAPVYDDDAAIYADLYTEIKSATAALNPSGDIVTSDLFYKGDIAKWKKLGNSILLRLGMRYSKLDPNKAKSIVIEAIAGGVMQSNADDAILKFNALFITPPNESIRAQNPYTYYAAEPIVNQFKATSDPRSTYLVGKYADPNLVLATNPDTAIPNQFGFPVGFDSESIKTNPNYRGTSGSGLNYSQLNYNAIASALAPIFLVTNSQTKLLLAEATARGWITSEGTAQSLYEAGIIASMNQYSLYPGGYGAISVADQNTYIAQPNVTYNTANALTLINTQYWISNFGYSMEAFANFRRTGIPALAPNSYNNNLNGGFIRRFSYPDVEASRNSKNFADASAAIGGDVLTTRVFWDIP